MISMMLRLVFLPRRGVTGVTMSLDWKHVAVFSCSLKVFTIKVVSGIALPVTPDKLYTVSKDETIRVWDFQNRVHSGWNAKGRMQDAQRLLMMECRKIMWLHFDTTGKGRLSLRRKRSLTAEICKEDVIALFLHKLSILGTSFGQFLLLSDNDVIAFTTERYNNLNKVYVGDVGCGERSQRRIEVAVVKLVVIRVLGAIDTYNRYRLDVGIKRLLDDLRVTATQVCVTAAKLKLVLDQL
ncbi:hypothetical protein Tco_0228749 [Tanacetum coccineum]